MSDDYDVLIEISAEEVKKAVDEREQRDAEIERLRAELSVEREKTQQARELASTRGLEAAGLSAERDELRKLLKEAWEVCAVFLGHDDRFQTMVGGNDIAVEKMLDDARGTLARMDAALKGGGDE